MPARIAHRSAATALGRPTFAAFSLAALLIACAPCTPRPPGNPAATSADSAAAPARILTRLYFGTDSPQGPVADRDFEAFLDTCVTVRFPAGLTRFRADGQWTGADGKLVKEKSWVVEIIRAGSAVDSAKIEAIVAAYKFRFEQEAVLRVEAMPTIRF